MTGIGRTGVVAVVLALVLAACGGGRDDGSGVASLSEETTTTAADTVRSDEEAALAFAQCMRDEGVTAFPDPTVDAQGNVRIFGGRLPRDVLGDVDRDVLRTAFDACVPLLEGTSFGLDRIDRTEIEDTLVEFAACMRDHGYDLPDPDFSQLGPGGSGPFGEIDRNDPAFQAALDVCQDVFTAHGFPGAPPRGRGGPGRGGGG